MRGFFVTGTDTGAGKSVLSAALLAAIARGGESVRAHKPVLTGLAEPGEEWPPDHELLGMAAGMMSEDVAPVRLQHPASPHLAAELEGARISPQALVRAALRAAGPAQEGTGGEPIVVVEGVGGLLVPLAEDFSVCDLAVALGLPLLVAARPGLGTINHTLLTLAAARARRLHVLAVVLTPWPERPDAIARSNRATIERLGAVEVAVLGQVREPSVAALAEAAATLPWRSWLAHAVPAV